MSGVKSYLRSARIISDGAMTSTNVLTSTEIDISAAECAAIELVWTGTPTGTFAVQACVNVAQAGAAPGAGVTFQTIVVPAAAAGAAGNHLINLSDMGFSKLRVTYTNSSGTGVLNAYITVKGV
jgi:hypothetical protein